MPRIAIKSTLVLNSDGSLTKKVSRQNGKKKDFPLVNPYRRNPANVTAKRYAEAKMLWKLYKSPKLNNMLPEENQVKDPLTNEQVETLLGTAYYHLFKGIGWIENPPY